MHEPDFAQDSGRNYTTTGVTLPGEQPVAIAHPNIEARLALLRDSDPADVEYISIMFEMKHEADATATKKRDEDFVKELDKDWPSAWEFAGPSLYPCAMVLS
ncbi:DUF2130 domain-containing protein [Leifsonia sp. EB34]|uniref:DUF2130 domain-containing protein n=1 Tax=Leifsonia sp. EB34 TaxID=3156303 RepID=UPI003519D171